MVVALIKNDGSTGGSDAAWALVTGSGPETAELKVVAGTQMKITYLGTTGIDTFKVNGGNMKAVSGNWNFPVSEDMAIVFSTSDYIAGQDQMAVNGSQTLTFMVGGVDKTGDADWSIVSGNDYLTIDEETKGKVN